MENKGLGWKREWINDWKKTNYKKVYTVLFYLGVFNFCTCCIPGTAVAQWLRCCATKSEGRWFDLSWCQWIFIDIKSFRSHYGPGVDWASNRNEYQAYWAFVACSRGELFYTTKKTQIFSTKTRLNPICHLLALLGAHHILHVSRMC